MKRIKIIITAFILLTTFNAIAQEVPTDGKKIIKVKESQRNTISIVFDANEANQ